MISPGDRRMITGPITAAPTRRLAHQRVYYRPVPPRMTPGGVFRKAAVLLTFALLTFTAGTVAYKLWVDAQTESLIYAPGNQTIPRRHVGMVFGAGLNRAGEPSAMLYDRVLTGVNLYKEGKVDKLLMTGDNSAVNYNEVAAMHRTAVKLGVPDEDIVLDYAGFNTWDSCYRARDVFGLSDATVVTQRFHLPRALYTCNAMGVNSIGVAADRQPYPTFYNESREYPALLNTAFRFLINDQPRFLGPRVDVDEVQAK